MPTKFRNTLVFLMNFGLCIVLCGCDALYRVLDKEGAEEKELIGVVIPFETNLVVEEIQHLSQKQPIVLVCRTQNRVKIAYEYLTNNSVINCQILEGGITDWVKSGKPAIRGRKSLSLEGQVRAIAGSLILLGVGLGVAVNLWFLLIPAFVGVGLLHAGLTDSCLMGIVLTKLPMNRIRPSPSSSGIQGGPS